MKLHFNKIPDGSFSVETWKDNQGLDYTTLGRLEFDKDQSAWVYWPEDLNGDGVTYFDSLEETKSTLQEEFDEAEEN